MQISNLQDSVHGSRVKMGLVVGNVKTIKGKKKFIMKLNIRQCSKMLFIDNNKKDKSILILNVEVIRKLLSLTLFCPF